MIDNRLDLNLLRLFVTVVEARTLTQAAQRLGMTRSNVSRRLKLLEADMGAQLMRRTTRHVEPTQAGMLLYRHGARMLEELTTAKAAIDSLGSTVRGDVRIRMPTGLGRLYLAPLLVEFARLYPDITLRVLINDYIGDLIPAEVDLALKITSAPPEDHVARKLCDVAWCLCASPAFLAQRDVPRSLGDLAAVDLIAPASLGRRFDLVFDAKRAPLALRVTPRIQSGDYPFLLDAALAGLGVALLPRYAVWRALREGHLQEVLPAHEPQGVGDSLYLLTAPQRYPTRATQVLKDYLHAHIRQHEADWARPDPADGAR